MRPEPAPAPTCEKDGVKARACSVCGETETRAIPATGHSPSGEWVTTKEPTDYSNGKKEHICPICGVKETVVIPALKVPLTGDGGYLIWVALLLVPGGTVALILLNRKKKHTT